MKLEEILKLPLYLQVAIASGFIAYLIARHSRREKEKTIDAIFGSITFGLPGMLAWLWLQSIGYALPQTIAVAIAINLGLALLWRKWGESYWFALLHYFRISNHDGMPSTWQALIQDTRITPTQLFVDLKNGIRLCCDDIDAFKNAPISSWSLDNDGNIAMYVTKVINKEGEEFPQDHIKDDDWGDMITYIPVAEISSVDIRFNKVINKKP